MILDDSVSTQINAWNIRYRIKGRQWGNAPFEFSNTAYEGFTLELGVGDGKNVRVRQNHISSIIGLDFSIESLLLCHNDKSLKNINLTAADARLLPFKNNSISKIFAHHIFGHIPYRNIPTAADEMLRVLLPEGKIEITVFSVDDMRYGRGKKIEDSTFLRGDGIITRYFLIPEIKNLFSKFSCVSIRQEDWEMKIKGTAYPRSIIAAEFSK